MNNLIFERYKEENLRIINTLKNGQEDATLLDEREKILRELVSLKIGKNESLMKYKEMGIDKLDKIIGDILKEKREKIKSQIRQTSIANKTNKSYAAATRTSNFFSAKV